LVIATLVLIVAYPLSYGPLVYFKERHQQLPKPARTIVAWKEVPTSFLLRPLTLLLIKPAFTASPVGSAYRNYVSWWGDLARKHNESSS
jgi:hypothetical protein